MGSVATCVASSSTAHLARWADHHRRLGVSHFIVEDASALTVLGDALLLPRSGRRWAFTESGALRLTAQPVVRTWMGQLEFLQGCIDTALTLKPMPAWLLNLDVDEYLLPAAQPPGRRQPPPSIASLLAPFAGETCLHLRRHNFMTPPPSAAAAGGPLYTSFRRAPFPPIAQPKGQRQHHGLNQPLHPKWLLNLRHVAQHELTRLPPGALSPFVSSLLSGQRQAGLQAGLEAVGRAEAAALAASSASGGGGGGQRTAAAKGWRLLVANQHAVLEASRCVRCVVGALTPRVPSAKAPKHPPPQTPEDASALPRGGAADGPSPSASSALRLDLAALSPFSLGFGAEFNEMAYLDGNTSNACQFPKACSLARSSRPGAFSSMPPPKQRLLSCFSSTAAGLINASGRIARAKPMRGFAPPQERCWRPVCLEGETPEAALRIHHYGFHTMDAAAVSGAVEDRHALAFAPESAA